MNEFEPWALEAFKLRNEDGLTYEEIVPLFRNRFPGFSDLKIYEKIRRQIARISRSATAPAQTDETVNTNETPAAEPTTHNNTETITKQWVKDHVGKGIAPSTQPYEGETIARFISELKTEGYCIDGSAEDGYKLSKAIKANEPKKIDIPWDGCEVIRFGLVSDTHINSKYTQLTYLHNFYDICAENRIDTVYHAGDIDDGEEMRMGHKYECYTQGADDHIAEIVRVYPRRKGIKTLFITGNHDASIIKRCGYDIGYGIAKEREDMQYLGQSIADVMLTPNCKFRLQHPWDGTAYSISYKPMKIIEAMQGGEKPNLIAIGNYHKCEYLFYRNVHAFQAGCFQAETPFMKNKAISAYMGAWIIELQVEKSTGFVKAIKPQFIPYYKPIKEDYKNWANFNS